MSMSNKESYQFVYRKLLLFSITAAILLIVYIIFVMNKHKEVPKAAYLLMSYLREATAESVLFEIMDSSLVEQKVKKWVPVDAIIEDARIVRQKFRIRPAPLLTTDGSQPLEAYLTSQNEIIPLQEDPFSESANRSWFFETKKGEEIRYLDATQMYADSNLRFDDKKWGRIMRSNGAISVFVEFEEGLFELVVRAKSLGQSPPGAEFDRLAQMAVKVDENIIGISRVARDKLSAYSYRWTEHPGWHVISVSLTNKYYNKTIGVDGKPLIFSRLLVVKDARIFELQSSVCLNIKTAVKERYLASPYVVTYLKSSTQKEHDNLIQFFKTRFGIKSLKNIITKKGYSIHTLLKNVDISNLSKYAIFAPPPTKIRVNVTVPREGMRLVFGYGIMEEAWDKPGDGVEFNVREDTKPPEPEVVLFSRYINPKKNESDRKWFQGEVDLSRYAGSNVTLVFETIGSQASQFMPTIDTSYDYAVWSS